MSALTLFINIVHNLQKRHPHLQRGHVLSSPAIEYKGRAFAFCAKDNIVLKLGDVALLEREGIRAAQHFMPFSDQVPSRSWTKVPYYYHHDWATLMEEALVSMRAELDP